MPKGQYTRKPKAEPVVVEPTGGVVIGDTVHPPLAEKTFVEPDPAPAPVEPAQYRQTAEDAAVLESYLATTHFGKMLAAGEIAPVTPGPSFDAWLDEDTSPIPANDRVSQMVQEWATGFIPVEHTVAWLPAKDGKALSVLLTTAHGTSELVADAGAWTEADVSAALAVMRDELKV